MKGPSHGQLRYYARFINAGAAERGLLTAAYGGFDARKGERKPL